MIRASIHGRLGADPVQRETSAGKPMVTGSLAVDVSKPGEEPATEWFSLLGFGKVAEALAQHAKGDLVSAMGPLTRSTFTDRDGKDRAGSSLLAESLLSARTTCARSSGAGTTRVTPITRARRAARRVYPAPLSPREAGASMPADRVDDLWRDGLVP
jgi:single-strand DNA-binding protein